MTDTIFAKIIRKEIPARIEYEDDFCLAFHDNAPQAPVHVLVIPKKPIVSLGEISSEDRDVLGALMVGINAVAKKLDLNAHGFRVVFNSGAGAGQTVFHLHAHILSGREFRWPPG